MANLGGGIDLLRHSVFCIYLGGQVCCEVLAIAANSNLGGSFKRNPPITPLAFTIVVDAPDTDHVLALWDKVCQRDALCGCEHAANNLEWIV